jgi:hypothetical protein
MYLEKIEYMLWVTKAIWKSAHQILGVNLKTHNIKKR